MCVCDRRDISEGMGTSALERWGTFEAIKSERMKLMEGPPCFEGTSAHAYWSFAGKLQ